MFGKIGDMLGKLKEIKEKVAEIKARMETVTADVSGASGDVKITVNGNRKILKLEIASSLQHGDKAELEKHLLETMNKAVAEADKINEGEMKKLAGGMLPPGLF
jgi:DNA-binding YbaB/EbfC family protein